jgi:protein-disulfide isomerase
MRIKSLLTAAVAVLALASCGSGETGAAKGDPVAAVAAPAGQQWVDVVSKTPAGGYIVGNPDAKIKLIEYASVTCSHCRDFKVEGFEPLMKDYVGTGKVSFELRNFLLNSYDVPISILTRCTGPDAYFGLTEQFFDSQTEFLNQAQKVDPAKLQAALALPENQRFVTLGQELGVIEFFKARGVPEDQAKACLAKPENAKELVDMTEKAGKEADVKGTPSFTLNGVNFGLEPGTSGWSQVKKRLQEAGAR